jgi:Ni/Co efflux regulator RcnB
MMKRVVAAALATAFLSVTAVAPSIAEEKKLTPQQQKMKDCSAKWKTEKTAKKLPGSEHNKFMSTCLKAA